MRTGWSLFGAVAALLAATPAFALTVVSGEALSTTLASGRYSGVGSLGFVDPNGGAGHSCTGALVSRNVVLTATHCLNGDPNYKFILPATGDYNRSGGEVFTIKSAMGIQNYLGTGVSDLAVITLAEVADGRDYYDLYTERDEIGREVSLVGAGLTGLMENGFDLSLRDLRLREGFNKYEVTYSDFIEKFSNLYGIHDVPREGEDRLLFDYDSGNAIDDTFDKVFGISDRGVYRNGILAEAGVIYGDSGGPNFIDGKIAGVNSATGSAGFFQLNGSQSCGQPGSLDRVRPGVLGCSDGSFGDFGSSMRVSFYADVVKNYIAVNAPVPEPSTWAMMVVGFFAVGMARRRHAPVRHASA